MDELRDFAVVLMTPEDAVKSAAWIVYLKNAELPGTYPDSLAPIASHWVGPIHNWW